MPPLVSRWFLISALISLVRNRQVKLCDHGSGSTGRSFGLGMPLSSRGHGTMQVDAVFSSTRSVKVPT